MIFYDVSVCSKVYCIDMNLAIRRFFEYPSGIDSGFLVVMTTIFRGFLIEMES